jgi:hypothetical protein
MDRQTNKQDKLLHQTDRRTDKIGICIRQTDGQTDEQDKHMIHFSQTDKMDRHYGHKMCTHKYSTSACVEEWEDFCR